MSTQYRPISNECNLNALAGASTPFRYTETFQGDVTYPTAWVTAHFTNTSMTSNLTTSGVRNPYYFGLAALVNPHSGGTLVKPNGNTIPEIVSQVHGDISFVLLCSVTVYDVQYDSVNG